MSASRPMTFTGCWTCKARKVKCDERPFSPSCGNCEKRGISCGGYGIRLQWVSDRPAQAKASQGPQGRRSLILDRNSQVYESKTIDQFLTILDQNDEARVSSRQGPFSMFPITEDSTPAITEDSSSTTPISNVSELPSLEATGHTPGLLDLEPTLDVAAWRPSTSAAPFSPCSLGAGSLSFEMDPFEGLPIDSERSKQQLITAEPASFEGEDPDTEASETAMALVRSTHSIPRTIDITIFGDSEADALMNHYDVHVASLLLPIDHAGNPFRRLYLSTALEGAMNHGANLATGKVTAYKAILQSLLASASFHRWNCDRRQVKYQEMGARYRYHAIRSLQAAIEEATPAANYQVLMTTMLSFVTIGVLCGDNDDFRVHIEAASQLRRLRSRWKVLSRTSKQLNAVGAFLSLLIRTLSFQASELPWTGFENSAEDRIIQSSSCYEYVYGVTITIATAISQTSFLADHLVRFTQEEEEDIPDNFLEACEELGSKLESWKFESEHITSISPSDVLGFTLLTYQAKAWHAAALIYYHTRIQDAEAADLIHEVDTVAENMFAVEQVKSEAMMTQNGTVMAPLTWPAFVAACNAVYDRREIWRELWDRMLCAKYRIGTFRRNWSVVRKVWETIDEAAQQGKLMKWTEAYDRVGIHILPT